MIKFLKISTQITIIAISAFIMAISGTFLYLAPKLPEVDILNDIKLQIPLRIYSNDGQLLGEFGDKRRTPVKREDVPDLFIQAFLAAEDDKFYQHPGVSVKGMARAVLQMLTGSSNQTGGSTITMQVAKNYFLTPERTIIRKLREIFLSLQIERALNKDEILELYVNKIFLGNRAYGIAAAAHVYYGKPSQELSLAQMAMIAGLPKAPSDYNPIANPERALIRRNWILGRMLKLQYIDQKAYEKAVASGITASRHDVDVAVNAPFVAEMARKYALKKFGEDAYTQGYRVFTTVNAGFQKAANEAVRKGVLAYDKRHGFRKPEATLKNLEPETLKQFFAESRSFNGLIPGVVTHIDKNKNLLTAALKNEQEIKLQFNQEILDTLPRYVNESATAKAPSNISQLLSAGDVIRLEQQADGSYQLSQLPEVESALISLQPDTGAILSMVGGFDFYKSKFNRSTQAARQVGSNIKPFVYAAAINSGLTPATLINDAPVVFNDAQLESTWRPDNSDKSFLGPTRLRVGLYRSRNLMSIRILQQTGISQTRKFINQFGLGLYQLPKDLSLALGSSSYSPLDMAQAYAAFANGGFGVKPYLVSDIYDGDGKRVYHGKPTLACEEDAHCQELAEQYIQPHLELEKASEQEAKPSQNTKTIEQTLAQAKPLINSEEYTKAKRIMSKQVAFIMDDMLKDVIQKGTGYRAYRALGRKDLAGKTGTTNGPTDTWFSGYNHDVVATAWLGFDNNSNLGRGEYGGSAALPMWVDYMQVALKNSPEQSRQPPMGIVSVLIDSNTGKQAAPGSSDTLFEYIQESQLESIKIEGSAPKDVPVDLENLFN